MTGLRHSRAAVDYAVIAVGELKAGCKFARDCVGGPVSELRQLLQRHVVVQAERRALLCKLPQPSSNGAFKDARLPHR